MINRLYFNVIKNSKETKKTLFNEIVKERETIGYYNLPFIDISDILEYASCLEKSISHIVVLGIGGSSLGTRAIYEFLRPKKIATRELLFFETTDPLNITHLLSKIDVAKTHFLVISKSGNTIETISIFKYLYKIQNASTSYTFVTDHGSPLEKFADSIGSKVFNIPSAVGGRFSVLSSVGLLPLAMCGVDIKALLCGAKKIEESFFHEGYIKDALLRKAMFYAKNNTLYNINCLFAYSETLKYFCEWYVQLWGESLGKKQRHSAFNVGLTPIGLVGPKDQHSFLQLIVEGRRDKSVTFIKIKDFKNELSVPNISLKHLESLDIVNNLAFHDLINMQCASTIEALIAQEDIPLDEIEIHGVDEGSIGQLIYYYELLTSLVAKLINVNAYDQPGVEAGKLILKAKLTS